MQELKKSGLLVFIVIVFCFLQGCIEVPQTTGIQTNAMGTGSAAAKSPYPATGQVINVQSGLNIRKGPSTQDKVVGSLGPDEEVLVLQEQDGWYQVQKSSKGQLREGWAYSKYIHIDEQATVSEDKSQADHSAMKNRTMLEGAAVGGALGALVGQLTGKSTTATVLGGVIGAGIGTGAGYFVANKKEDYANEEAYLDDCIQEAQEYNQVAKESNANLKKQIATKKERIDKLKSQIASGKDSQEEIQAELKDINKKQQAVDQIIESLESQLDAQKNALANVSDDDLDQVGQLQNEIAVCQQEVESLKAQREELANLMIEMSQLTV